MSNQLSLFHEEVKPPEINFWERFYSWKPQVGQSARIYTTIAYCEQFNDKCYCAGMRVTIKSITGDTAICETTKDWQEACRIADTDNSVNTAGNIWHVPVKQLAPILNELK